MLVVLEPEPGHLGERAVKQTAGPHAGGAGALLSPTSPPPILPDILTGAAGSFPAGTKETGA